MVSRRVLLLVAVLCILSLAGCGALSDQSPPTTASPATTSASTPTTTTKSTVATTSTSTTTRDTPAKGTQFVDVRRLENQSRITEIDDSKKILFENLSGPRQRAFLDALHNGTVTINRSDANPFSFYNQSRPEYVHYNNTWYFVGTSIV